MKEEDQAELVESLARGQEALDASAEGLGVLRLIVQQTELARTSMLSSWSELKLYLIDTTLPRWAVMRRGESFRFVGLEPPD